MSEHLHLLYGARVGRLTVLGDCPKDKAPEGTPKSYLNFTLRWCECDCGKVLVAPESMLKRKQVKSCGCLRRDKSDHRNRIRSLRAQLKTVREQIRATVQTYWREEKARASASELDELSARVKQLKEHEQTLKKQLAELL